MKRRPSKSHLTDRKYILYRMWGNTWISVYFVCRLECCCAIRWGSSVDSFLTFSRVARGHRSTHACTAFASTCAYIAFGSFVRYPRPANIVCTRAPCSRFLTRCTYVVVVGNTRRVKRDDGYGTHRKWFTSVSGTGNGLRRRRRRQRWDFALRAIIIIIFRLSRRQDIALCSGLRETV